jgi:hypothetical protein
MRGKVSIWLEFEDFAYCLPKQRLPNSVLDQAQGCIEGATVEKVLLIWLYRPAQFRVRAGN